MKENRFLLKVLKRFLIVVLSILVLVVATSIIYHNIASDDLSIQKEYEAKKEKCELLKTIASDSIEEGKGINTQKIPGENIRYKIYNDDENIVFYYYIEEDNLNENPYNARITLSNDYKILDEEYNIELENYETYKQTIQRMDVMLSLTCGLFFVLILCVISAIFLTFKWCFECEKNKKLQKKTDINS